MTKYRTYYEQARVWDGRAEAAEAAGCEEAVAHCKKMARGCRSDGAAASRFHRAELEKLPLTAEEKAHWAPMLHATWQAIGPDAEAAMAGSGQRLTRGVIVEFVVDANRVQEYGGMTDEEYAFLSVVYCRKSGVAWLRKELNY